MRLLSWICWAVLLCVLFACGGSGGSTGPITFKSIKISPDKFTLKPNGTIQLTGIVDGTSQPVKWRVGNLASGSVTQGGVYTAPVRSGNYFVFLSLESDPSKSAYAAATVDSGYVVVVNGSSVVGPGRTTQLTASVTGAGDQSVTWTTSAGSISPTGLLTAPNTLGDVTVTATSVADIGKSTNFVITVSPLVEIVDATSTRRAIPRSSFDFDAKVLNTPSSEVDWTASSGTIDADGIWTANNSTLGNVTITATSRIDATKKATSTVNVVSNLNVRYNFEGRGSVVLALRPDKAPNHCANLVSLVNKKFYDTILIHRYEPGFVVQWGDPLTKTLPLSDPSIGTGGPGYTIPFEANDLLHTKYALGMARSTGMDTAGSQIYLCLEAAPGLDGNYVVFGSVASGETVVDTLRRGDKITTAVVELP